MAATALPHEALDHRPLAALASLVDVSKLRVAGEEEVATPASTQLPEPPAEVHVDLTAIPVAAPAAEAAPLTIPVLVAVHTDGETVEAPREPKTHRGRGPKRDPKPAPVVAPATEDNTVAIQVGRFINVKTPEADLANLIRRIKDQGGRAILRLSLASSNDDEAHKSEVVFGLSVVSKDRVQMRVRTGTGLIGGLFPEGLTLFRDEVLELRAPSDERLQPTRGLQGVLLLVDSVYQARRARRQS